MSLDESPNLTLWQERSDLAAAFRWTARLNMHEAVANHFSLAVNAEGTQFLINPNQVHFSRIRASELPPIDQNTATFYNRVVIDEQFGGLAFEDEGERCAAMLSDPAKKVMVMGNHGVLVLGDSVGDAFNRLYYFERAAETYIRALQTGQPLRRIPDEIAEQTARDLENYPGQAEAHLTAIRRILDHESSDYAT